jgi:uncharacterized membrane protein YdjX (TVP38/TMEM64 family)
MRPIVRLRRPPVDPRVRLVSLVVVVLGAFLVIALSGSLSAEKVRDWADDLGAIGPILFVPLSACLTVLLVPGPLLAAASGLLFGTAVGTPVTIASATLGATLAFSVSRWWAGDAVVALGGPRLLAMRAWVGRNGFMSIFYSRLAPGVPYNLVNYAAGLTPVILRTFAAATLIGVAPRAFAYTALGGSLGNLRSPEGIAALTVLVLMASAGLALVARDVRRARRARAVALAQSSGSCGVGNEPPSMSSIR